VEPVTLAAIVNKQFAMTSATMLTGWYGIMDHSPDFNQTSCPWTDIVTFQANASANSDGKVGQD
jgi:hypothetical protein